MGRDIAEYLRQIDNDLDTADLLAEHGKYADSVFHSEQAAEKALKVLTMRQQRQVPMTHNLVRLARDLNLSDQIIKAAQELTPDYLTTRCVDAANGVPADMYDEDSARLHDDYARKIVQCVKKQLTKS